MKLMNKVKAMYQWVLNVLDFNEEVTELPILTEEEINEIVHREQVMLANRFM